MKGKIHSIQTLGTLDGPGVRFVAFMQGCPLRCGYCHNPDTWAAEGGTEYEEKELFDKVLRYRGYFGENGGVTLSGGEPLLQAEFAAGLFRLLKAENIHTALDTAGSIYNEKIEKLLEFTDLVLLDYKMTNSNDYLKYTGLEKEKADFFLSKLNEKGIKTWIRQVIVEGINDSTENIKILRDLKNKYPVIEKTELLPFKKLCVTKYEELNIPFKFNGYPETSSETMERLRSLLI